MASEEIVSDIAATWKAIQELPNGSLSPFEFKSSLHSKLGLNSEKTHSSLERISAEALELLLKSGLPAEALSFILDLKTSAERLESGKKVVVQNTSKLLLDNWIKSSSCAESLARYCLHPANPAENASFSRNLFAVPEVFQLPREEYLQHVLVECVVAVGVLAECVKSNFAKDEVRTSTISGVLDRAFLRYHTDQAHILPYFDSEDEFVNDEMPNPFFEFLEIATQLCSTCFISRRLFGKILLNISQVSGLKIIKSVFVVEAFLGSRATILLQSREDFLANVAWKQLLTTSMVLKSRISSFHFFHRWATFIGDGDAEAVAETVERLLDNWNVLMKSSSTDVITLTSLCTALVALAKVLKNKDHSYHLKLPAVLQGVSESLNSTNSEKQACGMACGQVYADLIGSGASSKTCATEAKAQQAEVVKQSTSTGVPPKKLHQAVSNQLKFESDHPLFLKLINYYFGDITEKKEITIAKTKVRPRNMIDFRTLDSDDDEDDGEVNMDTMSDTGNSEFQPYDMSNDTPVSEFMMSLKSSDKKVPLYFSDILEILLEAPSSKEEAAVEALKQVAIMKIPVLLFKNVKVDAPVAESIARVLIEIDTRSVAEIPLVCGLYELAKQFPLEVFNLIGKYSFDKDHYVGGHRMTMLSRFFEVTQLLSKQKCFSCFTESTGKLDRILEGVHAPFISEYVKNRRLAWKCKSCSKDDKINSCTPVLNCNQTVVTAEQKPAQKPKSDKLLTWREIVDQRIAAKTRRFASKKKEEVYCEDLYSAKIAPIAWAAIANRLMNLAPQLLSPSSVEALSVSLFTAQAFRVLGTVVFGTAGIYCPHYRNISLQSAELVNTYINHQDAQVRRSVISLIVAVVANSEGKGYILEAFESSGTFEKVKDVFQKENDTDVKKLCHDVLELVAASAVVQLGNLMIN